MTNDQQPDELTGPFGTARRVPLANYRDDSPAALDGWIITAPSWHPAWSQYMLGLVALADMDGVPPAHKKHAGVTHELIVMALNPEHGPYDARTLRHGDLHHLEPVNICEQFTASDDQARNLALLCVRAVVDGVLIPETADAPARIRAAWHSSIQQTLDHDRNPHHGRLN